MPEFDPLIHALSQCIDRLALTPVGNETYVGWYRGFPFAVTPTVIPGIRNSVTGSVEPAKLAIIAQLRFVGTPEDFAPDDAAITKPELRKRLDDGAIRIAFDDTIAWLTAYDIDAGFFEAELVDILDAMLDIIQKAGGRPDGKNCHYCRSKSIESLTWVEDRVAQICSECLRERLDEARREIRGTPHGMMLALIAGAAATVFGAAAWAGLWYLDFLLIDWLTPKHATELEVPHLLLFGEISVIGAATGLLVGWIVSIAPRAGRLVPRTIAVLAAISAAVVGDAATIKWIVDDDTLSLTFWQSIRAVPYYWQGMEREAGYRFIAIIAAVLFAALIAAPLSNKSR